MPNDTIDFSSLTAFRHIIKCVDFNNFLNLTQLFTYWCRDFDVCSSYVFFNFNFIFIYYFFFRAIVGAVFQPCRTCHMLFILLARCVVCVLGK